MKNKILFYTLLLCLGLTSKSQAQITLSPTDTTLCPGESYTIHGSFSSQFSSVHMDDYFADIVTDIGFPFVYYGDTFRYCVISANNFISFDTVLKGQYSSWVYASAESSTNQQIGNAIMFPFQDINMGLTNPGTINFQTFGVAPNRRFVVEFCKTKLFSCNLEVTDELVLYETSNIIEMNIKNKPSCTWNGGTAVQGLRYNTSQDLVPGRNAANLPWSATNDSRRFTYNGAGGYTIDSIAFNYVPIIADADSSDLIWYEEGNPIPIDTGASTTVTVTPGISYYVATITGSTCNDTTVYTFSDTSWVHIGTVHDTLNVGICAGSTYDFYGQLLSQPGQYDTVFSTYGGCDSFITLNLSIYQYPNVTLSDSTEIFVCPYTLGNLSLVYPSPNYTYQWFLNDVPTLDTGFGISTDNPGIYKVRVENHGCADTSISVQITLDTAVAEFDTKLRFGCQEDTVQFINLSGAGTYLWNFGDGTFPDDSTVNPTHIYPIQNAYNVRLIAEDLVGCKDTVTHLVDIRHPLIAGFIQSVDSICQTDGTPVQFTDTSIGNISNWEWDFGDGSSAIGKNQSHVYSLAGTHQIRLIISDTIPCYDTAIHTIYVDSLPFLNLTLDKHAICMGEAVNCNLDYLHTATKVHWDFGDNTNWNQDLGTHHSYDQPGIYWITVTADYPVCATVTDKDSVIVSDFPIVDLGPDSSLCLNGSPIILQNVATPVNPITQWRWNTGDTTQTLKVVHQGRYTLTATANDCSTTDAVIVSKDCYTDIPNAFTPNGDGDNDYFYPRQLLSQGVVSFQMIIYNRWGEKIFETTSINGRGWDGKFNDKTQPVGVYIYQINATFKNGNTENYTGNVTLIR